MAKMIRMSDMGQLSNICFQKITAALTVKDDRPRRGRLGWIGIRHRTETEKS